MGRRLQPAATTAQYGWGHASWGRSVGDVGNSRLKNECGAFGSRSRQAFGRSQKRAAGGGGGVGIDLDVLLMDCWAALEGLTRTATHAIHTDH